MYALPYLPLEGCKQYVHNFSGGCSVQQHVAISVDHRILSVVRVVVKVEKFICKSWLCCMLPQQFHVTLLWQVKEFTFKIVNNTFLS